MRADILVLFLILGRKHPVFDHIVCSLWVFHRCLPFIADVFFYSYSIECFYCERVSRFWQILFLSPWFCRWDGRSYFPVPRWLDTCVSVTFPIPTVLSLAVLLHMWRFSCGGACGQHSGEVSPRCLYSLTWQCWPYGEPGSWSFWSSVAEITRNGVWFFF